jgi:hypothetical protein
MEDHLKRHAGDPALEVVIQEIWNQVLREVRRG